MWSRPRSYVSPEVRDLRNRGRDAHLFALLMSVATLTYKLCGITYVFRLRNAVATRSKLQNGRSRSEKFVFDSVATCGRSSSFLSGVEFWVATSDHIHSRRCRRQPALCSWVHPSVLRMSCRDILRPLAPSRPQRRRRRRPGCFRT